MAVDKTLGDIRIESLQDVVQSLLREFSTEWSLPHRILMRLEESGRSVPVPVMELWQLARDNAVLPPESLGAPEDFQTVVKHAISLLRAAAIHLYIQGKNSGGWLLSYGPEISWRCEKEHIEELLSRNTLVP